MTVNVNLQKVGVLRHHYVTVRIYPIFSTFSNLLPQTSIVNGLLAVLFFMGLKFTIVQKQQPHENPYSQHAIRPYIKVIEQTIFLVSLILLIPLIKKIFARISTYIESITLLVEMVLQMVYSLIINVIYVKKEKNKKTNTFYKPKA